MNLATNKLLVLLAVICFSVMTVAGVMSGLDFKDLLPLGLAFFSAAFLIP